MIFSVNRKLPDQQLVSQYSTGVKGERCTSKAVSRSMTVYNKHLSNQCNFTAQTEQVHDTRIHVSMDIRFFGFKSFNYIRKINNITPYVPRLDLNVTIG